MCYGGSVEGYLRVMPILHSVTYSPKFLCLPHVISILYAGVWINDTCMKGMSPIELHAFLFEAQEKYIKLILGWNLVRHVRINSSRIGVGEMNPATNCCLGLFWLQPLKLWSPKWHNLIRTLLYRGEGFNLPFFIEETGWYKCKWARL